VLSGVGHEGGKVNPLKTPSASIGINVREEKKEIKGPRVLT
jgi:hypothetical protein